MTSVLMDPVNRRAPLRAKRGVLFGVRMVYDRSYVSPAVHDLSHVMCVVPSPCVSIHPPFCTSDTSNPAGTVSSIVPMSVFVGTTISFMCSCVCGYERVTLPRFTSMSAGFSRTTSGCTMRRVMGVLSFLWKVAVTVIV